MRDLLDIASRNQLLPPINTAGTDHDFAVFISNRPCGDKVTDLATRTGDCRNLFWTPAPLSPQERDRLLDFAAYRELVKDYQGSLLLQPSLKALLEQGKNEPFIADVLAASSDETLAETLAQCIPADPAHA